MKRILLLFAFHMKYWLLLLFAFHMKYWVLLLFAFYMKCRILLLFEFHMKYWPPDLEANCMLNKKSRIAAKGWSSSFGIGENNKPLA
jgi:hypothetical protein